MKKSTLSRRFPVFILCSLFFVLQVKAQNPIRFEYDEAGNCIVKYKTVTLAPSRARANTDNNDETDETPVPAPASVEDVVGNLKITIFPNPTQGLLQIEIQHTDTELAVNYTLSDMRGKTLLAAKAADTHIMLDISRFAAGAYLLRLTVNGKSETYKIIKE